MLIVLHYSIVLSFIFALALLFLDLFLSLRVCMICANNYLGYLLTILVTYFRTVGLESLPVWDFEPMHRVWGRVSTLSKASGLGTKTPKAGEYLSNKY